MDMDAQRKGTQLKRHLTITLIAIMMLFTGLLSPNGWGQTDRGSISGTVVDRKSVV